MNKKLIALYFLDELLSIFGMGVALFWAAGRIDWWPAWVAIAVMLVCLTVVGIVILRLHPELLAERLAPPKGAKSWDRAILSLLRLMQLVRYILAGLDQRFGWTVGFPLAAQIVASMACFLGYAVLAWALASNEFFLQIVRIHSDRSQSVVMGGPYRYVRHPAYAGLILFELTMPSLLASWWAIIVSGLCAILIILRTVLEDRTLQAELTGYMDNAHQVRCCLLSRIW